MPVLTANCFKAKKAVSGLKVRYCMVPAHNTNTQKNANILIALIAITYREASPFSCVPFSFWLIQLMLYLSITVSESSTLLFPSNTSPLFLS